jgi:precorrin-8X/cobalt-precorrin-8 methylmutase
MSIFDRYVMVDWSGASTPRAGKDSIWICSLAGAGDCLTQNPPTRGAARESLRDLLVRSVGHGERVLAGFDFPFGYPAGFAAALHLEGQPWRAIWTLLAEQIIDDPATNVSNRFEVANDLNRRLGVDAAFWGRPRTLLLDYLPSTRDVAYRAPDAKQGLAEWRVAEQLLRRQGRRPQPAWKLLGAGSAGSQALTGIPVVAALRADPALAGVSRVWPFERAAGLPPAGLPAAGLPAAGLPQAGLPAGEPAIVYAEVWPSRYDFTAAPGTCVDEKQVRNLAEVLRSLDQGGALADMLRRVPYAADEEGWILGAVGA